MNKNSIYTNFVYSFYGSTGDNDGYANAVPVFTNSIYDIAGGFIAPVVVSFKLSDTDVFGAFAPVVQFLML